MKLLVDGMLSGTGLRDAVEGGYVEPETLGLAKRLETELAAWLADYEEVHYAGFPPEAVTRLDQRGLSLRERLAAALPAIEIGYYSNGLLKRLA